MKIALMEQILACSGLLAAILLATSCTVPTETTPEAPTAGLIRQIVIDPTNPVKVNACNYGVGVLRSVNKGDGGTWSKYNTGLDNLNCLSLAIAPANPNKMFAGSFGTGVYRTLNGGQSWEHFGDFRSSSYVNDLVIPTTTGLVKSKVYAGTGLAAGAHGIYKRPVNAPNLGSWVSLDLERAIKKPDVLSIAISPTNNDVIYVGTDGDGIYKTTNGGANWARVDNGLKHLSVYALAIRGVLPVKIFAGTNGGVYRSDDGGDTWSPILNVTYVNDLKAVATGPFSTLLVAGTLGGVFKSTDSGGAWTKLNNGLASTHIYAVEVDRDNTNRMFAGDSNGRIYKTTDGGIQWTMVFNPLFP